MIVEFKMWMKDDASALEKNVCDFPYINDIIII